MAFFLQLRILLWKNFSFKKRTPFVLAFEIFIPLVLFVILLAIRQKQPPIPRSAMRFRTKPLPSAGIFPIMQEFCDGGHRKDGYGMRVLDDKQLTSFLEQFQDIAEHNNFFDPGYSPAEMDEIPELYRSIIDDPAAMQNGFQNLQGVQLSWFIEDKQDFVHTLEQNFSLPATEVSSLLNATLNFTQILQLVFGNNITFETIVKYYSKMESTPLTIAPQSYPVGSGSSWNIWTKGLKSPKLNVNNNQASFYKLYQIISQSASSHRTGGNLVHEFTNVDRTTSPRQPLISKLLQSLSEMQKRGEHESMDGIDGAYWQRDNRPYHDRTLDNISEHDNSATHNDNQQGDNRLQFEPLGIFGAEDDLNQQGNEPSFRQRRSIPELSDFLVGAPDVRVGEDPVSKWLLKLITSNPKLLLQPAVQQILLGGKITNPQFLADFIKLSVLSVPDLKLLCKDDEISQILIAQSPQEHPQLEAALSRICNLTGSQWIALSQLLQRDVSSSRISRLLHLAQFNLSSSEERLHSFYSNLHKFISFEKNLQVLSTFSSKLPQDTCPQHQTRSRNHTENTSNTSETYMTTTLSTNESTTTPPHITTPLPGSEKMKENPYSGLVQVWLSMQKTVCGHIISQDKIDKFTHSNKLDDLGLSDQLQSNIGILIHALYSRPRILYAPNNTAANTVVQKANATFALIDMISEYAQHWLNASLEIRKYLLQNTTDLNLDAIREIHHELHAAPSLVQLIPDPLIKEFIRNGSVPDSAVLLQQLDAVDSAACSWLQLLKGIDLNPFRGFANEEELIDYFLHHAYDDGVTVFASVVFTNIEDPDILPPHVAYKIRQNASFTPPTRFVRSKYWHPGINGWGEMYYKFGFVWMQDMIDRAIVDVHAGRMVVEPAGYIHRMPVPCYQRDQFLFMIEHVMPLCLTISWVYSVAMLVQCIVYEKEQRLKEVMRMMGLSNAVHWLAWFITAFSQMSVTMVILTVMLKYGNVLAHTNVVIIFLALEVFALATIAFSFLVSVCYSKAKVAAACAGIVYFLSYVPYMYVAIKEEVSSEKISAWIKSMASLFSTTSFGLGAKYFALYEIEGVGVQWDNLGVSPVEGDRFSLFLVLLMMVLDTLLYGILTWYIETVHPGSYGLPKPWYFPLMPDYWCGSNSAQCSWGCLLPWRPRHQLSVMEEDQACALEEASTGGSSVFEPEPVHLPLGVCVSGLNKVYKNGKQAVSNLSLNLFEGQITSFLGHNGAGKTTTMSILTGLFPPTSGYATIYGIDIRTGMDDIRKSLGMCPQHNVLFDKLTVEEHLWFYARLKGMNAENIKEETDRMIADLGLPKKRHCLVDCLSGGMQRKLSVAIAFVAGSQTVILDEPTAGVDPYARRAIWDLLVKYKEGRTILLSTHHMDEADILGDRIAIISNGRLKCCGASLFLKSTFGEGYHLFIVKRSSEEDLRSADTLSTTTTGDDQYGTSLPFPTKCCESKVTKFVRHHVSTAYLKAESSRELHYILPFEEAKKGSFEKLFDALDISLDTLEGSSYGVMDTSLEEVFLKVTEQAQNSTGDGEETEDLDETNPVPIPGSENQQHADKDTSSLRSASILLGSLDTHDVELGILSQTHQQPPSLHSQDHAALTQSHQSHQLNHSPDLGLPSLLTHQAPLSFPQPFLINQQAASHPISPLAHLPSVNLLAHQSTAPIQPAIFHRTHQRSRSSGSVDMRILHLRSTVNPTFGPVRENILISNSPGYRGSASGPLTTDSLGGGTAGSPHFVRTHRRSQSSGTDSTLFMAPSLPDVRLLNLDVGSHFSLNEDDVPLLDASDLQSLDMTEGRGTYVVRGQRLLLQQFVAIICKRFYYIKRNWRALFSQILLPALFVSIAMTVALSAPQASDLPVMVLSPAQYYNYTGPSGQYIPFGNNASAATNSHWSKDASPEELIKSFHLASGVAATCVLQTPFNSSFDEAVLRLINSTYRDFKLLEKYFNSECASVFVKGLPLENFMPPPHTVTPSAPENMSNIVTSAPHDTQASLYPNCHCLKNSAGQACSKSGYVRPPQWQVVSGDTLQDINGLGPREEAFYLNTYDQYRLDRYSGISVGLLQEFVPPHFGRGGPVEFRKLAVRHAAEGWYNDNGFHAMPVTVNILNNAILRANLPAAKGNPAAYGITTYSHPMNNTNNGNLMEYILQGSDVLIAIFIICAMSFVPASFVLFLVYERFIKAKHLQVVSGLSRVIYWLANYCWDMCNFLIPATCCILILRGFNIPAYVNGANFPAVISLFLLYGWSITPMMYPASFLFREPSSAYIFLIVINLFIGITCIITSFLLEMFERNDQDLEKVHYWLKWIFLLFPNYALGRGLMDIAFNEYWNEFFFKTGQYAKMHSPFEWMIVARNMVFMACMGFIFFIITLLCEFNFFIKAKPASARSLQAPQEEDNDVKQERRRVLRGSGRHDILRLDNLTKVYKTQRLGTHLAVDRVCLGVPQGECFGLLGVNGAGKTTTFKMMTGDLKPTGGDAFLDGHSILTSPHQVQQNIGYCPQFDALYDELTGREHIQLYARLRGVPYKDQAQVVDWALKKLGLTSLADCLSGTYSGGNKRKLSTAIALIGQPSVIFLDEPTTGMDPHSRRFLWDFILNLVSEGKSVILTSHSMEECEALCTRLAIMVNGVFKCLGSTQHLKTRFGDGYTLSIRLRGPNYDTALTRVKRYILRKFPEANLKVFINFVKQQQEIVAEREDVTVECESDRSSGSSTDYTHRPAPHAAATTRQPGLSSSAPYYHGSAVQSDDAELQPLNHVEETLEDEEEADFGSNGSQLVFLG